MKQMSISSILKTTDNQVTRMVDRLALDQQQKAYLDSIDSYINLSRSVFCRKKTVDQHIEYLQEKHAQNMKDTHYVVQPKQIQNATGNIIKSLKNDELINKLKTLNQDIEEKVNAFNETKKKRNEMIDEYGEEYKKLRQDLIKDYQTKCESMQNETKKQIEEIQEKYKIMNECIPELTIEQLKAENSFKKMAYNDNQDINDKDQSNDDKDENKDQNKDENKNENKETETPNPTDANNTDGDKKNENETTGKVEP